MLSTNPKYSEKTLVRQRKAAGLASLEGEPRVKILWLSVLVAPSRQGVVSMQGWRVRTITRLNLVQQRILKTLLCSCDIASK